MSCGVKGQCMRSDVSRRGGGQCVPSHIPFHPHLCLSLVVYFFVYGSMFIHSVSTSNIDDRVLETKPAHQKTKVDMATFFFMASTHLLFSAWQVRRGPLSLPQLHERGGKMFVRMDILLSLNRLAAPTSSKEKQTNQQQKPFFSFFLTSPQLPPSTYR